MTSRNNRRMLKFIRNFKKSVNIMARQRVEGSSLFSVEKREDQNFLHTEFVGDGFVARNIQETDLPFYEKLFGDEKVVKLFADGQIKDADWVRGRYNTWNGRFSACQPHGGLTVFDSKTNEPIGHVVAGIGSGQGVSELAAAFEVSSQGLGICSTLLKAAVEVWAEEVNGIGVGKIADDHFPQLQAAFRCFGGDVLRRFDAIYSPLNIASGKILGKAGFVRAQTALCTDNTFDLTNTDLSLARVHDAEIIATKFLEGREPNKRYVCIDEGGKEHTLSFKENFGSFRFHVEREIGR